MKTAKMIAEAAPKLLALGSGGYVLDNIEAGWTLAWATLNALEPRAEDAVTFGGMFWGDGLSSLMDQPHFVPDSIKKKTAKEVQRVYRYIKKTVFPILGIKV